MAGLDRFAVVIPGIFSVRTPERGPILKAGGDVRTAMILRSETSNAPTPVLFASKAAIEAFRSTVPEKLEAYSVDNLFDDISGNILTLSIFLTIRFLSSFLALNLTRAGRSVPGLYSTSNALPDVAICALSKCFGRKPKWVAVVHHIPENRVSNYSNLFQRGVSLLSFAVALRLVARFADRVIAYHGPTIERLQLLGVGADRLVLSANGVDLVEIGEARKVALPRKTNKVVCVSRLSRLKGIPDLLRIWSKVSRLRPGARLTLIGAEDALNYDAVAGLVHAVGVSSSVRLRGVVPREELLAELLSSRLSVAPSFVEGWGLSVLESLACGTPVVAWDLEAYHPFRPAIITVPISDETAFVSKVLLCLDDDVEWAKRSEVALKVSGRFSWSEVAAREWAALREAFVTGN